MRMQTNLIMWPEDEAEFQLFANEYLSNSDYYLVWPQKREDIPDCDKLILNHVKTGSRVYICRKDEHYGSI